MFEDVGIGMIPQPSPPSVCAELPASSSSPPTLLYEKGGGEAGRPAPADFQLWMIYMEQGRVAYKQSICTVWMIYLEQGRVA